VGFSGAIIIDFQWAKTSVTKKPSFSLCPVWGYLFVENAIKAKSAPYGVTRSQRVTPYGAPAWGAAGGYKGLAPRGK